MQYHLVKWLSRIVCLLPATLRQILGRLVGWLCWPLVPAKRRKMAIDNICRSLKMD
ncbi:MAG: lpxL 1, partial [Sporomusa sp.]|nr:lpxL 1 [Sporomusa sp.]